MPSSSSRSRMLTAPGVPSPTVQPPAGPLTAPTGVMTAAVPHAKTSVSSPEAAAFSHSSVEIRRSSTLCPASFVAQAQAVEKGCDQVVWLDAVERRWVEEMGGMNLFFVFGSGDNARVVTPELTGSLLPGVTRKSLLQLASRLGYKVEERRISTDEWEKAAASGELTETFACGTAAVITPVGHVKHTGGEFTIADGQPGALTMKLREELTGIQEGTHPDVDHWMVPLG